jgi:hypothetical protein
MWEPKLTNSQNALVHSLALPNEINYLEEVNIPRAVAESLLGRTVSVEVLPEEQPATREVSPDDVPLLIDPQGNYWNDYRPIRVLYTDEQGRVWRLRKNWLPGLHPPIENFMNSENPAPDKRSSIEILHLPTEWDLWEINIPWETTHRFGKRQVEVEVHRTANRASTVFWADPSGSLWRIPNDWRKRRIRLPESRTLSMYGIPGSVADAYGGRIVSVNYHPGSLCCLPNQYRFRDASGNAWPVKIADCLVLG